GAQGDLLEGVAGGGLAVLPGEHEAGRDAGRMEIAPVAGGLAAGVLDGGVEIGGGEDLAFEEGWANDRLAHGFFLPSRAFRRFSRSSFLFVCSASRFRRPSRSPCAFSRSVAFFFCAASRRPTAAGAAGSGCVAATGAGAGAAGRLWKNGKPCGSCSRMSSLSWRNADASLVRSVVDGQRESKSCLSSRCPRSRQQSAAAICCNSRRGSQ